MKRALAALVVCICLAAASGQARAVEPNEPWRTTETAHFRVSYPQRLAPLGRYFARLAEDVHATLSPLLEWQPRAKTEIAITDSTDSPNGMTNVYPYNWIQLYAVPPDRASVLGDYDDWARLLIAHEHTHVLQLDTKSGLPALYNLIFGGRMHPNQYMPRWYTEGIAVYSESLLTAGGRERSSLFEMFLRTDVLENSFLTLDQMTGSLDRWPGGDVPYLYGGKFMQYLADKYGNKTFAALGYLYGQRLIPYALSTVLKKATDDDFVRLYDEWRQSLVARYAEDAKRLRELGLSEPVYLTQSGQMSDVPRFFPDGERVLYFHDEQKSGRIGWYVYSPKSDTHEKLVDVDDNGGAALTADGHGLVTAAKVVTREARVYNDLFLHDLSGREEARRLTKGLRAREPACAPDGHTLAFVQYMPGRSQLMLLNLDGGERWAPIPPGTFDQVFSPAFSPDGRYLAFVGWRFGEAKNLYLFDLRSQTLRRLSDDSSQKLSPVFAPDGRSLLYSSDKTGIYNIYRTALKDGATQRLTNVLNGVFAPALSADGKTLYVASYRRKGFDLARIDLAPADLRPQTTQALTPRPLSKPEPAPLTAVERPYSPFPSLLPKTWFPSMGEDHAGSTLGVNFSGSDISGRHGFAADVALGVESRDPTLAFSYTNSTFIPTLSFALAHTSYTLRGAAFDGQKRIDQREVASSGSLYVSVPFSSVELKNDTLWPQNHYLNFGAYFRHTRVLNRQKSFEPTTMPATYADTGLLSGFSLGYSYSARRYYTGFNSAAGGRSLYVGLRGSTKILGSQVEAITVTAAYNEYLPIPFTQSQILAFHLAGGISASTYRLRRAFYIGGPPDRDVVSDLVREARDYGDYLRGYRPASQGGDRYWILKSEYRVVLWTIERGLYTWPLFFTRLNLAPFYDVGYAWLNDFNIRNTRQGLGAELRLDMLLGYQLNVTLNFGYHHGVSKGGIHQIFFGLDNVF